MTAERVDDAVMRIRQRDATIGRWVDLAAGALTWGEGEEVIYQAGLQDFLWYQLPRKWDSEDWLPVTNGAAVLLDELSLGRYAEIARSATTASILETWRGDEHRGFERYRAAVEASGVTPPDTDVLTWGQVMGSREAEARTRLEVELERAVVAGELRPGLAAWRRQQAALTARILQEPDPDSPDKTLLASILGERVDGWARYAGSKTLAAWRTAAAEHLIAAGTAPPLPPENVQVVVRPLAWLLDGCRIGVTLTQAGYLPPAMVREAVDGFGWWRWHGRPRTEVDVPEIGAVRDIAKRLRLVTKRGHKLKTSKEGARCLEDPVGLWRLLGSNVGCQDDYCSSISELIAHRLLAGPAQDQELGESVAPTVAARGWFSDGAPLSLESIRISVHEPLREWRLFGLLDETRAAWLKGGAREGHDVTTLNEAGRATALHFLYSLATAPRNGF
jgi:hypothetical protein